MKDLHEWYRDSKFGLFIHWGAYSAQGVEASWPIMAPGMSEAMFRVPSDISEKEYVNLPSKFNPVEFNPYHWVKIALDAGMKYIVFTSKHHDGFCMFDAPGTDYKITNTPYGKDICFELAQACSRAGMPLGFYYSPPDMHHPGYRDTTKPITKNWTGSPKRKEWSIYLDYMESHIRKLLTDYGHISLLWFDGLANHGKYEPERFHKLIRELSPGTLINDRLGEGYDFVTPEQFIPKTGIPSKNPAMPPGMDPGGDVFFNSVNFLFKLPVMKGIIKKQMQKYTDGELELSPVYQEDYPSPDRFQPWETCMTLGNTWAYNPREKQWKESRQIIINLINTASKGGNYLLNIGPTDKGVFPEQALERLDEIGFWMKKYSKCLYGSTYTPLGQQDWGRAVRKNANVYLFIINRPENSRLIIKDFPGDVNSVSLYSGDKLFFKKKSTSLEIDLPDSDTGSDIQVIDVDISGNVSAWKNYSEPVDSRIKPSKYLLKKVFSCLWINMLANGIIALFSYINHAPVTVTEASADASVTAVIIAFIVSLLLTDSVKNDYYLRKFRHSETISEKKIFPANSHIRNILIAIITAAVTGFIINFLPGIFGVMFFSNLSYIIVKAIYAGTAGAFAVFLSVGSVIVEKRNIDKFN